MIRHLPEGRGHPYLVEPDQRVPLRPVPGAPFELRATAPDGADPLELELERGGRRESHPARCRGAAVADEESSYGIAASPPRTGHLSAAMTRGDGQPGRLSWAVELPGLPAGSELRYRFCSAGETTDWFDVTVGEWASDASALRLDAPAEIAGRLLEGSVESLGDGALRYRLRFAVRLEPGEHVVGFGERFDRLDQRGQLVDTRVFDQYKGQGTRSYLPMPYAIVVGGGFGFHVDTGRRCFFDVGRADPRRLTVEVDLEPGAVDEAVTLRLFAGDPGEVLRSFCERTGVADEPPPEWIYRLWLSGNEWNSERRVLAEVERCADEGIPAGVVVIEAWSDEQTFVAFGDAGYEPHPDGAPHALDDFDFPPDGRWPDPKRMVDALHERGFKVLLWQIPLVESGEGQAGFDKQTMIERGYCVRAGDGEPYRNPGGWFSGALMLDFTNAEAAGWWLEKRRYLVEEVGIDGFKTDGGEHAWGADLVYSDGSRGGETNNRYPVLYGAAYHSLLRSCGRKPVTFSRAGFTGAGAYPCHWAGDADSTWEAFRASITAGLSAGASGVFFWGWDLAGFSGELPSAELYLRATATAALCPIMQLHSEFDHHRVPSRERTPWNVAAQTGDERVLPAFRRFAELRERLVPYLAEQGRRTIRERTPLLRALFFDHPGDDRLWDFPFQYMLGDALLVAPVCEEGATAWTLYLPPGEWIDVWSGERRPGGAEIEVDAPLDRIPIFCTAARARELVPLFAEPSADAGARSGTPLEVS